MRFLSAGAVASLLVSPFCIAASPAAGPSPKETPAAKPVVSPLEPGQLSQLPLPDGVTSLCVIRVQKLLGALEAKGLGGLASGFVEGLDPQSPSPLRTANLISATVASTEDNALIILYALQEPADLSRCEGMRPAQSIGGWKTWTYKEDGSQYCQITPGNILFVRKERLSAGRAEKEVRLHRQLPRLVRGMSECRARTALIPVALLAGAEKESAPASLRDGLRLMTVELELEPQLKLTGRLDFTSAKRATEVAADITAAWPFLATRPGIPDDPPEMRVEGSQLQAELALYPAVMAAESLRDAKFMRRSRNQRNAQNIVSNFQASVSSGVRSFRDVQSLEEIVRLLQAGVTVDDEESPFHGKTFRIGKLTPEDAEGAAQYIIFSKEGLDYFQFGDLENVEPSRQASTYAQLIAQMWETSLREKQVEGSGLKSPQDAVDRLSALKGRTESRLGQAYFSLSPEHITKGLSILKVDDGELMGEMPPASELDAFRRLAGMDHLTREEAENLKAREDAMHISQMFAAARSSGAAGLNQIRSAEEAVRILSRGVEVKDRSSPFCGVRYTLSEIKGARIRAALLHLKFEDGELKYRFE